MQKFILLLFVIISLTACNNSSSYAPDDYLSESQQDSFKNDIIRFVDKLAKRATHETKFDPKFDEEYERKAKVLNLDKYYESKSDRYIYFETSKIAPSIHERYVATGGRLKKDAEGNITEYEEIYRTWKMAKEVLAQKTPKFFEYMIKGKDLSPYYTANIGDTEHIEFPDHQTFFNKETRKWEMKIPDSLAK